MSRRVFSSILSRIRRTPKQSSQGVRNWESSSLSITSASSLVGTHYPRTEGILDIFGQYSRCYTIGLHISKTDKFYGRQSIVPCSIRMLTSGSTPKSSRKGANE
ncbi:putative Import inner membrane translocase subunit tim21, mitochondrial,putative, partial [Zostera marina]